MSRSVLGQSKSGSALRIFVIDSHKVYRTGLRSVIADRMPGTEIFEADSLNRGLSELRFIDTFDLVLIDLDFSTFRSLQLLKPAFAASPNTRFAVISASDTRQNILAGLAAGFHGFISKHQFDDDILQAIKDIASGRIYVPPSLARAEHTDARGDINGDARPEMPPAIESDAEFLKLTPRQREVLSHLALGMSNKEIARALHIAEATTKIHAAALLRTLGARNRTEAAFKAGRLVKSLDRSPPLSPNSAEATTVREDGRTLPLRLMKSNPTAQAVGAALRRKPASLD
jgi:DNA-binding NarL/FixJ family response regulator